MRLLLLCMLCCFIILSCKNKTAKEQIKEPEKKPDTTITVLDKAPNKDSVLQELTEKALTAFKQRDYTTLAEMVHPEEGVRFSSYGYIDTLLDKVISADWIRKQGTLPKQDKLKWGEYDATGKSIFFTLDGYIKEFVYDAEFLQPEKKAVNQFIGGGNSQNNLLAIYNGCDFTECHFSGFDPKYDGMDWKSLRLVFKLKDGKYYLVGVVHDEWTI